MIFGKFWRYIKAQLNKLGNYFRAKDPIAEMQYECDLATQQMKEGRRGLEQYRGLVERLTRQVNEGRKHYHDLAAKVQSYLASGDREIAGRFALELQRTDAQVRENEAQLKIHEEAYQNNLLKVKHASHIIKEVQDKIAHYDSTLKMSKTEAEIAKLAQSLNFDVTTDFGQVEQLVQEKIDHNRAQVRVAADLSSQGLEQIKRDEDIEKARAEEALKQFEQVGWVVEDERTVKWDKEQSEYLRKRLEG